MLDEADQPRYAQEFEPYLKGSSGQYVYHLEGEDIAGHLQGIGELMHRLVEELPAHYRQEPSSPALRCAQRGASDQVLRRVFQEHFNLTESELCPKPGQELSACSLQSPDDWEATYRQKRGQGHRGYVTNLTETCHPENDLQLIVEVQTEPNHTDDAAMLAEALPSLKERTGVDQMNTDGGFDSPEVDELMRQLRVEQVQSAVRGRKPPEDKLGLDDFSWETDDDGQPQNVTCPQAQRVTVEPGRKPNRYCAPFDASHCQSCPFREQCPTDLLERQSKCVLRFSQRELDLALRRQRSAQARASGQNLRAAVEATVRSVEHPFGNAQVPVRGKPRVSMLMLGSAAMSNVRRIHRYLTDRKEAKEAEMAMQKRSASSPQLPSVFLFASFLPHLRNALSKLDLFRPAWACGF